MTLYEILALLLPVIIFLVTLFLRFIKYKRENKPKLNVANHSSGKSSFFAISNTGGGSACQLNLALIDYKGNLILDASERMHYPELNPNSALKLPAVFHLNGDLKYQLKLTWENKSGKNKQDIFWVDRT